MMPDNPRGRPPREAQVKLISTFYYVAIPEGAKKAISLRHAIDLLPTTMPRPGICGARAALDLLVRVGLLVKRRAYRLGEGTCTRFHRIGPLLSAEEFAHRCWPDHAHVAMKGGAKTKAKANGHSPLMPQGDRHSLLCARVFAALPVGFESRITRFELREQCSDMPGGPTLRGALQRLEDSKLVFHAVGPHGKALRFWREVDLRADKLVSMLCPRRKQKAHVPPPAKEQVKMELSGWTIENGSRSRTLVGVPVEAVAVPA
jgi:hypothetical protein